MTRPRCRICGTDRWTCGDDHMTLPPISSATYRGDTVTNPDQPKQLKEYEYYVGHMLMTAQLTEEQAKAMGAQPIGTNAPAPKEGQVDNKESERAASHMQAADAQGVTGGADPDAMDKARDTRNRRPR